MGVLGPTAGEVVMKLVIVFWVVTSEVTTIWLPILTKK
jgi:hypothetical protein